MTATFDLNSFDDLNADFIKRLKGLYRGKNIRLKLAIEDSEEYFLMNELNQRIEEIEQGEQLVSMNEDTFLKVIKDLKNR